MPAARFWFHILFFVVVSFASAARGAISAPAVLWSVQTTDDGVPDVAPALDGGVNVGSTFSPGTATLTHYSKTGAQVWRLTGGSLGLRTDSIHTDAAGNIYGNGDTLGSLHGPSQGGQELIIYKYTAAGAFVWGRQPSTALQDHAAGIATTPDGINYTTHEPWASNYGTPPAGTNAMLRQYLPDGTAGWVAQLNPNDGTYPGAGSNHSHGTALDSQANIVSTFSNYTNVNNFITIYSYLAKTNSSGQVQWVERINASNISSTAIDGSNNIYVAGGSILKFDPNGALLSTTSISNTGFYADCIGPDGTLYVAGNNNALGIIAAYDPTGAQLWSKTFTAPAPANRLSFYGLTLSGDQLIASGQLVTSPFNSGNYIVSLQVPEPATALLVWLAAGTLGIRRPRAMNFPHGVKWKPR